MARKAGSTDEPAPVGHNAPPLTKEDREALYIIHLANAREDNDKLAAAKAVFEAVKKARVLRRKALSSDGFDIHETDRILRDEERPRYEVEADEEIRHFQRTAANQPVGAQLELTFQNDSFTQQELDEAHWRGRGYTAGLRGADNDPPEECHPEFHQVFREGWADGQEKLIKSRFAVREMGREDVVGPDEEPAF